MKQCNGIIVVVDIMKPFQKVIVVVVHVMVEIVFDGINVVDIMRLMSMYNVY